MIQNSSNQKGEIEFRKKLYQEQVEGKDEFDGKLGYSSIESILSERMDKTLTDFRSLKEQIRLPKQYLEIGAERGQRSLILQNDLDRDGVALDISFDMLNSCTHYAQKFNKPHLPLRICSDVYNIPLASDSIPFVFVYEMLHHFPSPGPVIKELHRVLTPGGYFYFDEEPFKKVAHFKLYKKPLWTTPGPGFINKIKFLLDYFFLDNDLIEHQYDVIENHSIPIQEWEESLSLFDTCDIDLMSIKNIQSKLGTNAKGITYLLNYLLGGTIKGTCQKKGNPTKDKDSIPLKDKLICPECKSNTHKEELLHFDVTKIECPTCKTKFPIKNNVLFLFSKKSMEDLYPETRDT